MDNALLGWLNQFAGRSWAVDSLVVALSTNGLLKGGVLCTVLWWVWSKQDQAQAGRRNQAIALLASCVVSMLAARALAMTLPFRARPMHEATLAFVLPLGLKPTLLETWSSFPSDHAALFFALATGLLFISRPAGCFALIYTTLFIALPRAYLGLHYPTDLLAGAALGIGIATLGNLYVSNTAPVRRVARWATSYPGAFYPIFFLVTFQIADMFNTSRALAGALFHAVLGPGG